MNPSFDHSTYIVSRDPNRFGGKQDYFVQEGRRIVSTLIERFRGAKDRRDDLIELFKTTLRFLCEERNRIARQQNTPKAQDFGVLRSEPGTFNGPSTETALMGAYKDYNPRALARLAPVLQKLLPTPNGFKRKNVEFSEPKCEGRKSLLVLSVHNASNVGEWYFSGKDLEELSRRCEIPYPKDEASQNALFTNKEIAKKISDKAPDIFRNMILTMGTKFSLQINQNPKGVEFVCAAHRLEVGGKMLTLSQFIICSSTGMKSLKEMTERHFVVVQHQDPFLHEEMIEDMAKIFAQIIQWNKKSMKELQTWQALLRYEFSAMLCKRGSASIAEYFERGLYGVNGFSVAYRQDVVIDLEAYTLSFSDFVQKYPSMIQLKEFQD